MKRLLKIMDKFKFLLATFLFFSLFSSFFTLARAADLNIDCPTSPTACSKSGLDPLFNNSLDGFWYPGKSITKTLNLKNSSSEMQEMAIRGTRTSVVNILENVMHISIVGGTTVNWSGSVADFYGQNKIGMGIFTPGADLDYDFTVSMSSAADDSYQSKETVFDLTLGFWGEPISTPTPIPTSASGGGGAVLGAGVSAPVCGDTKPVGTPVLLSAIPGINSVQLIWSEGTGPLSYYLVAFGLTPGTITYGNPNIGGVGTTSYTVNNLSGGTTYYFRVRSGNGCTPGDYSNELAATPTGNVVAGLPGGFAQGVLGVSTQQGTPESTPTPTPTPETGRVLSGHTGSNLWWPWVALSLVIVSALFYWWKRQKKGR